MMRETNPRLPLWAKILFEAPELVKELLWQGKFPLVRGFFIDSITYILCRLDLIVIKSPSLLVTIQKFFRNSLEWIYKNWKSRVSVNGSLR